MGKEWISKKCVTCNKSFKVTPCRGEKAKYCSQPCRPAWNKGLKGFMSGDKSPHWKGGYDAIHNNRKRRARKIHAKGSHEAIEWEMLKLYYQHMCLCCKRQEPEVRLTQDHIIPLSKGGTDDIGNIQPLCQSCNSRKLTKVIDFRTERMVA